MFLAYKLMKFKIVVSLDGALIIGFTMGFLSSGSGLRVHQSAMTALFIGDLEVIFVPEDVFFCCEFSNAYSHSNVVVAFRFSYVQNFNCYFFILFSCIFNTEVEPLGKSVAVSVAF